ncbi:MAG: ProQ/FINO family protein [Gammaproteobacteria bacterium]|jgi:sRNA-binding protein
MPAPRKGCFEALQKLYAGRLDFTRPFSPGIRDQILAEGKISRDRLKRALAYHCDSVDYLQSVLLSDKRYGLDGEEGPAISAREREHAFKRMKKKITLERARGDHYARLYEAEARETKRHRKERKKINFDFGVLSRKLTKMTNKFDNSERQFVAFKRKMGLMDDAAAPAENPKPASVGPKVLVRKKRRVVVPDRNP